MYLQSIKTEEKKKGKFREIYDGLPQKEFVAPKTKFIQEICELCMVSKNTVYCWLAGTQKPDRLRTSMIAKKLGVDAESLFV